MNLDHKPLPLALLCIGFAFRLAVALQNPVHLQVWPLRDDSFYYFNIAWNLTHGGGLRHDSFNITTGFQPLFLLIISPFFWMAANKQLAITLTLLLQTIVGVLGGFSLYRLGQRFGRAASLLLLAVWAVSPVFVELDLNGMETSLVLYLVVVTIDYYLRRFVDGVAGRRQFFTLGILCGLSFLARIDLALMALVLAADILWRGLAADAFAETLDSLVPMAVGCAAFAMPWLTLNALISRSVLPSSGQAVRFMSQAYAFRFLGGNDRVLHRAFPIGRIPFAYYAASIRNGMSAAAHIAHHSFPAWVGGALIAFTAFSADTLRHVKRLWFLYALVGLQFLAYTCYIFGQWFFPRYLAVFSLAYLLLVAVAVAQIWGSSRLAPRLQRVAMLLAITVGLGSIAGTTVSEIGQLRTQEPMARYTATLWLNTHTPTDAIIGGFQTGVLGYYLERKFYALDGKVNGDALTAMQNKRIDWYVLDRHIDYLIDSPWILHDLFVKRSVDESILTPLVPMKISRNDVYRLPASHAAHARP
jgi:hypothetical protein